MKDLDSVLCQRRFEQPKTLIRHLDHIRMRAAITRREASEMFSQ